MIRKDSKPIKLNKMYRDRVFFVPSRLPQHFFKEIGMPKAFDAVYVAGEANANGIFRSKMILDAPRNNAPQKSFAIKLVPVPKKDVAGRLAQLEGRIAAINVVKDPGVVRHYGCFPTEDEKLGSVLAIVMEWIDGISPKSIIAKHGNGVDSTLLLKIICELASTLSALEKAGISHCDIKPSNILIENNGRVRLIDFGLSVIPGYPNPVYDCPGPKSIFGEFKGSFDYMAPEWAPERWPYTPFYGDSQSDIFAFCVLIHELATGKMPYESSASGLTGWSNRYGSLGGSPIQLDKGKLGQYPGLSDLLARGLNLDRSQRIASFAQIKAEFNGGKRHGAFM